MIDDRTPLLNLPLPHRDNELGVDVERLRQVISSIDTDLGRVLALVSVDDESLDELQEIVDYAKANRDSISGFNNKANKSDLTQLEEVQTLVGGQTIVNLVELDTAAGCEVYVEGLRLNKTQWVRDPEVSTRLTLSRSYPAGHSIAIVRLQGGL